LEPAIETLLGELAEIPACYNVSIRCSTLVCKRKIFGFLF